MKVTPRSAHSSANAGSSATKPQPDPGGVGTAGAQRPAQLLVVEVGRARAGLAQQDRLVGGAHERGPALGLGVQGDDRDVRCRAPRSAHGRRG